MVSKLSSATSASSSSSSSLFKTQHSDASFVEQFTYITKTLVNQELELQARSQLYKIKSRIKAHQILKEGRLEVAKLSFSTGFLNLKLCDVLEALGNPQTTQEFVSQLQVFIDEDSNNVTASSSAFTQDTTSTTTTTTQSSVPKTPSVPGSAPPPIGSTSKNKFIFPNPLVTPLNKVIPPLQTPMFSFGPQSCSKGEFPVPLPLHSAVKKTPRPAKPGEVVYAFSASGSPVLQPQPAPAPVVPPSTTRSARIKLDGGNGKLIDVDLIFRGKPEDEKMFPKVVTDFRGLLATRSQATARKLLPSRAMLNSRKNKSLPRRR